MGGGQKFWENQEDRAMVESTIGTEACDFFISSNTSLLPPPTTTDPNLQQGLRHLVEGSSDWDYAVFWLASNANNTSSDGCVLIWGDGHYRPHKKNSEEAKTEQEDETKRRVLRKLHSSFFGSGEEDRRLVNSRGLTDLDVFYLASLYFYFRCDSTKYGPAGTYVSGKALWASDLPSCLSYYRVRSFLARSAGFKTVLSSRLTLELWSSVR